MARDRELRFDGLVAVVTGAGRGLGRAYAQLLASRGCRVVVNDLSVGPTGESTGQDAAGEVVKEITAAGGQAVADRNDVVNGAEAIVANALDSYGQLDILINNAGILKPGTFADFPAADWQHIHDVHLRGTVNVTRAAWPALAGSDAAVIINTASTALFGLAGLSSYSTAKGGIFSFTRSLAIEGRDAGIRLNCILPAAATRLTGNLPPEHKKERERLMRPEFVAALVAWLAHPSNSASGVAISAAGNHARLVHFAVGDAVDVEEVTPEAWARSDLLEEGHGQIHLIGDMYEHVAKQSRDLGLPGFAQSDIS